MKTRCGYVSNSSSSSFMLMDDECIAGITEGDWMDMLKELYNDYDAKWHDHDEFCKKNHFDTWEFFSVFDLNNHRAEAIKSLGAALSEWNATNASVHDGVMKRECNSADLEYSEFLKELEEEIRVKHNAFISLYIHDGMDYYNSQEFTMSVWRDGRSIVSPVPKEYIDRISDKRSELGICTNRDVLENESSRFLVHFDDNECYNIRGMCDEEGWDTAPYTYGRLCEIFTTWFINNSKLPEEFDWHRLLDITLTVRMHEG